MPMLTDETAVVSRAGCVCNAGRIAHLPAPGLAAESAQVKHSDELPPIF
jgi:hypothetical protein